MGRLAERDHAKAPRGKGETKKEAAIIRKAAHGGEGRSSSHPLRTIALQTGKGILARLKAVLGRRAALALDIGGDTAGGSDGEEDGRDLHFDGCFRGWTGD